MAISVLVNEAMNRLRKSNLNRLTATTIDRLKEIKSRKKRAKIKSFFQHQKNTPKELESKVNDYANAVLLNLGSMTIIFTLTKVFLSKTLSFVVPMSQSHLCDKALNGSDCISADNGDHPHLATITTVVAWGLYQYCQLNKAANPKNLINNNTTDDKQSATSPSLHSS